MNTPYSRGSSTIFDIGMYTIGLYYRAEGYISRLQGHPAKPPQGNQGNSVGLYFILRSGSCANQGRGRNATMSHRLVCFQPTWPCVCSLCRFAT